MEIYLENIPVDGQRMAGDEPPEVLAVASGLPVRIDTALHFELFVQIVSDRLLVDGRLTARIATVCSRCGGPLAQTVTEPAYHFDAALAELGESVDLTEDMREAMLVLFPSYPVCDPACKGLCPSCGTNLNEGTCACEPPVDDDRWSLLNRWKT